MGLQKNHHVLDGALLVPRLYNLADALLANAQHRLQPLRFVLDDVQRLFAKPLHDAFSHHLAHAANQAGAEVALDALGGGGQ